MEEQEKHFEKIIPMKSVLGREFLALQSERNKQRRLFEESKDKMGFDTRLYRQSEIALGRFLDDMIPRVVKAQAMMKDSRERIEIAEDKAQREGNHGIQINRKDIRKIWVRFALDRYKDSFTKKERAKMKMYHPGLTQSISKAWKDFKTEIRRWQFGGQPYDGSQAMHSMIAFQVKVRLLSSAND